jgi:hypothetical protein
MTPWPANSGPWGGLDIGAHQPMEHMHRHFSHMFPIFPLALLTASSGPEARQLMEESVDHFYRYLPPNLFSIVGIAHLSAMIPGAHQPRATAPPVTTLHDCSDPVIQRA